jgi:putative ABC transport system substrate-binding protein
MKRRHFIAGLGAAVALPIAARAQPSRKPPIIGFLGSTSPSTASRWLAVFVRRLRELAWIEQRTVVLEIQWAEGRPERFPEIATGFVQDKVDVIVTYGSTGAVAAKQATSTIPIVFVLVADPVGAKLVQSLNQPGGNATGLSNQSSDLGSKKLEILREVLPRMRRLAVMVNIGNSGSMLEMAEVQAAGRSLGLDVVPLEIRRAEDITPAFEALKSQAEAVYVSGDPLFSANRVRINALATAALLPTMHGFREQVEAGGLMSYGTGFAELFGRAADYVDKILRGANPADIPVEQPTTFELIVNLRTAKALGLELPPTLLARADEVIE